MYQVSMEAIYAQVKKSFIQEVLYYRMFGKLKYTYHVFSTYIVSLKEFVNK